ncbi:MAG: thiamine diphosphokinase [Acidobacteria bacterium]|nr:thiamine diphosphokinase [Acidobacteriota bacterium]
MAIETILMFTGGDPPGPEIVDDLPAADLIIAADGGYDSAAELGFGVDVLVGDLDSIAATSIPDHVIVERHPADKDQTDLELALELAIREDPSRLVVVSGAGGRHDHELATAALLCSRRWERIDELDWLSSRSRAHVVRGRRILHGDIGSILSLIPAAEAASGITTKGLKWNLTDETLLYGETRGVSNVMTSPVADIRVASGCLMVVLPFGFQP